MVEPINVAALENMLNEPHYKAIGKLAANWAVFEVLAGSALWRLARVGVCLTSQIPNMARRIDALISLVRLRGGSKKLIAKLDEFGKATFGLQDQRNRIVHDPWHIDRNTGQIQRLEVSAKKAVKFGFVPMSVGDINHVVDLTVGHIDRFDNLMKEVWGQVEASPEKPRQ